METNEFLTKWFKARVNKTVRISIKGKDKLVGRILAVDDFGNVQLELDDSFGSSAIIQRSGIAFAEEIKDEG
jgi:small nuclear ribonucleoprotein (snRNP)-like protein